ncbi:MAG: hypothetical protein HY909_08085 [Deltaproteobacteria bacterium]|nr:hypothetical protein [Deltaproteobacteria bacterium]
MAHKHQVSRAVVLLSLLAGCGGNGGNNPPPAGDAGGDAGGDATAPKDAVGDGAAPTDGAGDAAADTQPPVDVVEPGSCGVGAMVAGYVTELGTMGWGALNRSRAMMMYGCAGAARPQDCLAMVPLADDSNIGANRSALPSAHLRVLFTSPTRSTYWSRSSPDGRFFARGVKVYDLVNRTEITATGAMYDPAFFPDNSGYMYQPGGRLCPMSTLTTGMPTAVAVNAAPCSGSSVGLYEHLGASLGGEDYWASAAGTAAWDDGGRRATFQETPRNEAWTARAQTSLTLMANTGSGFRFISSRNITTPFQGDGMISPSSRALLTRFVDEAGAYQGYVLHRLEATRTGAAITATLTEMARYCTVGAKATLSYDERWAVYHHYIGRGPSAPADARDLGFADENDAGFAPYAAQGAANIYLLDLRTGRRTRVTNMGPGQYALFPHFRSDGWIYFLVRTPASPQEHAVASDAALVMP